MSQQPQLFQDPPSEVTLRVAGKVPSFKNSKMILTQVRTKMGFRKLERPLLITKPEFQERMREIMDGFESQLRSSFPTGGGQTYQESSIRSWIAWCVPADDCWTLIPEIKITGQKCGIGEEGAEIVIERL